MRSKLGSYVIDENKIFGVIGIASPAARIINATFSFADSASEIAGKESAYVMEMTPSEDLNKNIMFRVIFPDVYDLSYIYPSYCSAVANDENITIAGEFSCSVSETEPNILDFKGNSEPIEKGTRIRC